MVEVLVEKLKTLKVKIDVVDQKLDITAPKGVITQTLAEEIKLNKSELIDFVNFHKEKTLEITDINPAPIQKSYPLSSAQRRLWYLCQFEQESISFNIPSHKVFLGKCNEEVFLKALLSTIERHEILRTIFVTDQNGEPSQVVVPTQEINFKLDYKDFSGLNDKEALVNNYIISDSSKAFDFEKGPLLRAAILKLSDSEYVFYYNIHHIISDGWSLNVIANDVQEYYTAYSQNREPQLEPLKIQYKDFTVWQLNNLTGEKAKQQEEYWTNQFSGEIPVLELPFQKERPLHKTSKGHRLQTYFTKELTHNLKEFCKENEGSIFMGLLTTLNVLFSRYTNQNEFVIGFPMAGRDHLQLENQIGFYLNTIALKNAVNPEDSFKTTYNLIKNTTFKAYENQQYPFDRLVEELKIKKDNSRNPIFDVLLILQNFTDNNDVIKTDSTNTIFDYGEDVSKYELNFTFQEVGDTMSMEVVFNSDIYEKQDVSKMMEHFITILDNSLQQTTQPISEIKYLSAEEENELLNLFNATEVDFSGAKSIVELFEIQVDKTPDAIALIYEDKQLTYKELNDVSNQFADYLIKYCFVKKGDIVAIQLKHSEMYAACLLGILKAGCCCSPLDVDLPKEKLNHVKNSSNEFVDQTLLDSFLKLRDSYNQSNLNRNYSLEDDAYIIYTSGSTGVPKGCVLQHKGIVNHLFNKVDLLDLDSDTTICHTSKLYFVGGIWQLWAPLISGGKVIINSLEDLIDIPSLIEKAIQYDVKILEVIPSQLNILFAINSQDKLKGIQKLILTGEKLTVSYVNKFFDINPHIEIINTYGISETSDVITEYKLSQKIEKGKILIGKPIQNTKIYILDKYNQLCPIGIVGEICASGLGISNGYLNQNELTKEKFIDNPFEKNNTKLYKSGDLAKWLPDGTIEIIGRMDHQVSIRGFRIELTEIENALLKHTSIREIVVLPIEMEEGQLSLVAYLTFKEEKVSTSELRNFLKERIQEYMIPSFFVVLDELPLTSNGKVNKRELPYPKGYEIASGVEYVAPANHEEAVLVSLIQDILKKDEVGVKDNFYDLGGDSIKLVQLLFQLKKLGYSLKPEQFIKSTNIEAVADVLKNLKDEELNFNTPDFKKNSLTVPFTSGIERFELSENQKFMMKHKNSQAIIGPYVTEFDTIESFEYHFREFYSNFPELHIQIRKENNTLYQYLVPVNEVNITIVQDKMDLSNHDAIVEEERRINELEYDIANGELIKLFIFNDVNSNKALFYLGLSHTLADLYTCNFLTDSFSGFFADHQMSDTKPFKYSSIDYAAWQKNYLESETGKESRLFWLNYLNGIGNYNPVTSGLLSEKATNNTNYVEQSIVITGENYLDIKEYVKKRNISLSSFLMAYHQVVLNECFSDDVLFQMILVNSRENIIEGVDVSAVLGVINNMLPIKVETFDTTDFEKFASSLNLNYLNLRQNQLIPFETIRKDFLQNSNNDISLSQSAVVNIQVHDDEFDQSQQSISINYPKVDRNVNLDLTCKIKNNGIQIQILCNEKIYSRFNATVLQEDFLINLLKQTPKQ